MPNEIGYVTDPGLAGWASFIDENETNPDLQWPQSIDIYDRMRREDPQVASVLRAVMLPIRRATWMIDPAGADPEVVAHIAADLGLPVKGEQADAPLRTRGRFSWDEHLRLALLELVFGHSVFEQVYRFEAGAFHLSKLGWRPPRTISKWDVARDGGLVAVEQFAVTGSTNVRIGVERLVVYTNEREGSWIGQSLLRQAYKMWRLKDRVLRVQALVMERNGLGIPLHTSGEVPAAYANDRAAAEDWMRKDRAEGLKIAKSLRAGELAGVSLPSGGKLELLAPNGKLPDAEKPIRYYDEQIARAVLAHFLNLGTETGSWALGSTFANFFTDSLNAVAGHIADVAQQHIIEDLVDLNWGPAARAPRIVPAPIGEEQAATADAIKALIECGAITPEEGLEEHMRARYRLPVLSKKDAAGPSSADVALAVANVVQKSYLGVPSVMTRREARALARMAGADLPDEPDPAPDETTKEAG